ncbi:MAG: sensor histidine kinase [Flammeovirgaceae bacterium]
MQMNPKNSKNLHQKFQPYQVYLFVVLLLVFSSPSLVFAQQKGIKFDHITDESGQSLGTIRQIYQDKLGFVWLGTEAGLKRFDGHHFKTYTLDEQDEKSISSLSINAIGADKKGNLWVGTDNGLNKYDAAKENFQRYYSPQHKTDDPHLTNNFIHTLFFDKNGFLWIGTRRGLSKLNLQTNRFEHFTENISARKNIEGGEIVSICEDHEGFIWISLLGKGVFRFHPQQGRIFFYHQDDKKMNNLPTNFVYQIYVDSQRNLWLATDIGLCWYDKGKDGFIIYSNGTQLANKSINCIFEDLNNNLWIGTKSDGLWKLELKSYTLQNFINNSSNPLSLRSNQIHSVIEDKTGILWVGTADGLHKHYKRSEAFAVLQKEIDKSNTLPDNVVKSVFQDNTGNFWIGTSSGIARYQPNNSSLSSGTYEIFPQPEFSFLKKSISSIYQDTKGQIWIGSEDGELAILDAQRKSKRLNVPNSSFFSLIGKDAVNNFLVDCQQQFWVGTEAGLFKVDLETYNPELVPIDPERIETIHITTLFEEKCQYLWIGTEGQGLIRLEYASGNISKYTYSSDNEGSLSSNTIHDIYADRNGTIWIGTLRGLNKYNKEKDNFEVFTEKEGLVGNVIKSILEDKRGRLWIGTNNGLCRFDTYYLQFKNFDMRDGLPSNLFNVRAALLSKEGQMLFGTYGGLLMFNPDSVFDDTTLPSVHITDFKVIDPTFSSKDKSKIHRFLDLEKPIYETQELVLSPDDKIFTLSVAALHYAAPAKNQFAYKLEGFDNNWIYTSSRKEISYMNLPHGEYTFKVKASNHDGYWNKEGASLKIRILPSLYERWWFRLLVAVGLVGIAYLYYAFRLRQIEQQKQILERTVAMRTSQLAEEKSKVEKINEEIKRQNFELASKNEEIQQQKEEIITQKEYILQKNSLLEDAQKTIEAQNQQLLFTNQQLEIKVKERTQELIKTYDELMKTSTQIDNLLYRTAHDIKGPIARILGLCQVAQMQVSSEEMKDFFVRLEKEGKEMDKMLSRMNRAIEIKNISVDYLYPILFVDTIQKVVEHLRESEEVDKVKIFIDVEEGIQCESDPRLIEILLECLISNAIRYRDHSKSERYVKIEVKSIEPLQQIEIKVEDNGIGIPEGMTEKVFDMFFIGSTQSKGHGLGLFEARLIVDKLEGSISLLREEGKPTVFKVCIPSNTADRE